ncbi:pentapeptide repeat-containing protein [Oscillatoria sp. FACHB-1407]|uniref:pentapeptide repeat-containing protein n=1 Tax=Oscillatoria sp. FACHB-1407 TaxID=2692847 RepID=UPI001682B1A5|nr:pentapeptide repeat-containing protein [Oscillatoria sp. FACHB-1407]MBD2462301.1 pentapeptide repeat-containing protein [Oscillatoria sp. FACHB-1407]
MKKSKHVRSIATPFSVRTAVLLGILILLLAWQVPKWQTSDLGLSGKDQADVENAYRQTWLQAIGGLFFLVTAYLSWKNLQISEDKQITERFSKAVEMLGNSLIEVRLGGIYVLARIARDSPEDHWTVMEVLTAFIREKAGVQMLKSEDEADYSQRFASVTTDIQAALNVIGEREISNDPKEKHLDLNGAKLTGANLSNTNLTGANLSNTNLSFANLSNTIFNKANLTGVKLNNTDLTGAVLTEANLSYTDLSNAVLTEANLSNTNLSFANLNGVHINGETKLDDKWHLVWRIVNERVSDANFGNVDLSNANLIGVNLSNANLGYAKLNNALLKGANLTEANLSGADLVVADLRNSNLNNANLNGANLNGASLSNANFSRAFLSGTNLSNAYLSNADLSNADLTYADLSNTYLDGANLSEANLNGTILRGTDLSDAKNLTDEQLNAAKLCKTQLPEGSELDRNRDCSK